jgi:hypothetical protein
MLKKYNEDKRQTVNVIENTMFNVGNTRESKNKFTIATETIRYYGTNQIGKVWNGNG